MVEPKLKMTIAGDEKRFTDTIATYTHHPREPRHGDGAQRARAGDLAAQRPARRAAPSGARWDPSTGKLVWTIPQIDPGEKEKVTLTFQVRMGGVGLYQVTAAAQADGGLSDNANVNTDVPGLADFEFEILERRRVLDVADTTAFQIRIKNIGTILRESTAADVDNALRLRADGR